MSLKAQFHAGIVQAMTPIQPVHIKEPVDALSEKLSKTLGRSSDMKAHIEKCFEKMLSAALHQGHNANMKPSADGGAGPTFRNNK